MNSEIVISDPTHTKPTYALKHLATFKVYYENEGYKAIEKLKQLMEWNRKGEIIPLDMYMRFSGYWLIILNNNMEEIENFPGALITQPTAFVSQDENDEYNNILMFTVPGASLGLSEVHIFQVCNVSAIYLVEDLKQLRRGEIVTIDRNHQSEEVASKTSESSISNGKENNAHELTAELTVGEKNAQTNEQLARDVKITNHCFEDIECFLGRLQYIAEILRELDLNRNEHNTFRRDVLLARSNSPTQDEFQDILAKHKLAFNCITKLQSHFNNSVEPLHNLFISLKTIVEICNNVYVGQHIPQAVIYPLLTQDTIAFLRMHINEDELNLWCSLGMNWLRAKHEFHQHQEAYKPTFYNGWKPDFSLDESSASERNHLPTDSFNYDFDVVENGSQGTTTISKWLQNLQSRNALIAKVLYSKTGQNEKELTVAKEEYLEILDDTKLWWKARNSKGNIGYVPNTFLSLHHYGRHLNEKKRDYQPNEIDYTINTENGLVEQEFNEYSPKMSHSADFVGIPVGQTSILSKQLRAHSLNTADIPHPPPMPAVSGQFCDESNNDNKLQHNKRILLSTFNSYGSEESQKEVLSSINEELKLTLMQRERRKDLEIMKTPQIYINQNSKPNEVQQWLLAKGFSEKVQKKLYGLNGAEILALPLHVIENYFDHKESRRLISQIVLQKNFCEYRTLRSSEFSTKLARARQKTEELPADC